MGVGALRVDDSFSASGTFRLHDLFGPLDTLNAGDSLLDDGTLLADG